MTDSGLSTPQLEVINALSSGVSIADAAAQAGIHRNTIANWRRNNLLFQYALSNAQYDRALLYREQAEALVEQAYETLAALLADPETPPSVRLKAALYIIEKATTPPPPKAQPLLDIEKVRVSADPPVAIDTEMNIVQPVHNSAQQPYRREHPKIGRNEPCPCKSGKKYKQCCLNKQPEAA